MGKRCPKNTRIGFTIVELLIVIVVIAILAAITLIAYNGIRERSSNSSVQASVTSLAKKIEASRFAVDNTSESYPATITNFSEATGGSTTFDYQTIAASNYYCLTGTQSNTSYYISSIDSTARRGVCPPTSGLILWVPLTSSTKDYVSGQLANASPDISYGTSQNGQDKGAAVLNGTSSFLRYDATPVAVGQPGITMSAWVNIASGTSTFQSIISKNGPYILWMLASQQIQSGLLKTSWYWTNTSQTLQYGAWTLVTVTYDGAIRKTYINGSIVGTDGQITGAINTSGASVTIGSDLAGGGRFFLKGSLDDVRVYNRALSDQEVQTLFQSNAQ